MKKATDLMHCNALPCAAHTMQLMANDAVLCQSAVSDLLALCRIFVGRFKHSASARDRLKQLQEKFNLPKHVLVQDEPTQWDSCLERLCEQRSALNEFASEDEGVPILQAHHWSLMKSVIALLKPLEEFTKKVLSFIAFLQFPLECSLIV